MIVTAPRRLASRLRVTGPAKHLILLVGAGAMLFPFYWMLTTSFKTFAEAGQYPPALWPSEWHLENWVDAWNFPNTFWGRAFANTIGMAAATTAGLLVTSVLAGYAFARMRFRGRGVLFALLLVTLYIPNEAQLIPNFVLTSRRYLNLYDTYAVQVIPFVAGVFGIFLMRQFFLAMPGELQDAARIDGAGNLRFLWSIALPLVQPALVTIALVTLLASWNAFLWPLIFTASQDIRPVQLAVNQFSNEAGSRYHLAMAGAAFTILPMVAVYLLAQRYFIEGIARTGIRG